MFQQDFRISEPAEGSQSRLAKFRAMVCCLRPKVATTFDHEIDFAASLGLLQLCGSILSTCTYVSPVWLSD